MHTYLGEEEENELPPLVLSEEMFTKEGDYTDKGILFVKRYMITNYAELKLVGIGTRMLMPCENELMFNLLEQRLKHLSDDEKIRTRAMLEVGYRHIYRLNCHERSYVSNILEYFWHVVYRTCELGLYYDYLHNDQLKKDSIELYNDVEQKSLEIIASEEDGTLQRLLSTCSYDMLVISIAMFELEEINLCRVGNFFVYRSDEGIGIAPIKQEIFRDATRDLKFEILFNYIEDNDFYNFSIVSKSLCNTFRSNSSIVTDRQRNQALTQIKEVSTFSVSGEMVSTHPVEKCEIHQLVECNKCSAVFYTIAGNVMDEIPVLRTLMNTFCRMPMWLMLKVRQIFNGSKVKFVNSRNLWEVVNASIVNHDIFLLLRYFKQIGISDRIIDIALRAQCYHMVMLNRSLNKGDVGSKFLNMC